MKEIIEQLNNLQVGDLVWWRDDRVDATTVIGIITHLYDPNDDGSIWRAEFPQDGEYCYWDTNCHGYAKDGMLGVVWKSET